MDVAELVAVVLRDLGIDGKVRWRDYEFDDVNVPDDLHMVLVTVAIPGGGVLSAVVNALRPDLAQLADDLQADASESDAYWAEPVPPCPGHGHPALPRELDGEAWWVCPATAARIARFGEFPR